MRANNLHLRAVPMRLGGACLGGGLALSQPGMADTVDRPHFKVDGVAIVWAADSAGTTPIVSDFIIGGGGSSARSSFAV